MVVCVCVSACKTVTENNYRDYIIWIIHQGTAV